MPYLSDEEVMARFVELVHRGERLALPVPRPFMRPHPDAPSLVSVRVVLHCSIHREFGSIMI
jgi:hypothetical protein